MQLSELYYYVTLRSMVCLNFGVRWRTISHWCFAFSRISHSQRGRIQITAESLICFMQGFIKPLRHFHVCFVDIDWGNPLQ